ncbi:MAG: hypothetical protein FJ304_21165 [Planctomycetes bacterium]|nr:hypothetical protein [Planctomycetota bacterium]
MPTLDNLIPPTARQQAVFDFVRDHWFAHGYPPTLRDVCDHMEISSPNGVLGHLRALVTKGKLRRVSLCRHGETRTVYAPVAPELRVAGSERGRVVVGSIGGPVSYSAEQWRAWLLARLGETVPAG